VNSRAAVILVAAAILLPVALFLYSVEFYREEDDFGWSLRAWINPLLAAEQFLVALDVPVRTTGRLLVDEPFPERGTIYLSDLGQVLTDGQGERLLDWIHGGGHLVMAANTWEDDHLLMEYVSVEVDYAGCGCDETEEEHAAHSGDGEEQENDTEEGEEEEELSFSESLRKFNEELRNFVVEVEEEEIDPADLTRLSFDGIDGELEIALDTYAVLTHPSLEPPDEEGGDGPSAEIVGQLLDENPERVDYLGEPYNATLDLALDNTGTQPRWIYEPLYYGGSENGIHFMQFEIGEGLLTIMSGDSPFENDYIGDYDHAYLLWVLASDSTETLLLYGLAYPGLGQVIWENWPEAIISFGLLLAAILWASSRRFGPILDRERHARRGIDEHLRSSGEFHWRHGQVDALLAPLAAEVTEHARRTLPNFEAADRADRVALLAGHCALPGADVADALYGEKPRSTGAFTRRVQILLTLRERL